MTNRIQDLQKLIKLTGERAKLDAKANGTYIVYQLGKGQIVKEYVNGVIEPLENSEAQHE
ncbi:hypothetical protein [Paenibacillus popilliae]|uniref:Uncharacterized protein n=1 Tax=Paenibacillus popilliae ATCC 14706 TaxID=1212764 RepID=M9LMA1_PAEPP|nr:hypothetical protein [Paenibacillus popilliae]GAC44485.1 hypothetical protein PPOP_3891 [Paenibacillus popilliae ATCC 14706]